MPACFDESKALRLFHVKSRWCAQWNWINDGEQTENTGGKLETKEIIDNIGYCGLICSLCHLVKDCSGCRSNNNSCGRYLSEAGCYQYNCCKERNLNGCWECGDFDCGKDMFSESHDVRLRAFVRFIKDEGLEQLAKCILQNETNDIKYGYQKDYDGLETEEDVIRLLKTGIRRERKE